MNNTYLILALGTACTVLPYVIQEVEIKPTGECVHG